MVLLSVGENATDRPAMSELVSMHSNEVANLLSPKQPAFFICESYEIFSSTHKYAG